MEVNMPKTLFLFSLLLVIVLTNSSDAGQVQHHGYLVSGDGGSHECLSCHNGSRARPVSSCLRGNCPLEGPHPVEKPYPPAGLETEFLPTFELERARIKLVNGRISCISCHNLSNPQPMHPAVDPATTNLCLLCHLK